jgi:hypothetical protein
MLYPPDFDPNLYVVLEIDGPGVHVASVDDPGLLELAAAFFQLLRVNASESAGALALTDVRIFDKCAAVAAKPDRFDLAKDCIEDVVRQIAGADPPRGGIEFATRARFAVRRLPPECSVEVSVGALHRDVVALSSILQEPLDSMLSIRATPIRTGGRNAAVRFTSDMEEDFTLDTTRAIARDIGAHLYSEVDIEGTVRRALDGTIASGRLISFEPVESGDPRPAWREWFHSVGGDSQ